MLFVVLTLFFGAGSLTSIVGFVLVSLRHRELDRQFEVRQRERDKRESERLLEHEKRDRDRDFDRRSELLEREQRETERWKRQLEREWERIAREGEREQERLQRQRLQRDKEREARQQREIGRLLERLHASDKVNAATDRMMGVFRSEYSDGFDDDETDSPTSQSSPGGPAPNAA